MSALLTVGTLLSASAADAHITRIQTTTTESPTFGGYSWPGVGRYEKIVGKAFDEVDPTDPLNAVIVDIYSSSPFVRCRKSFTRHALALGTQCRRR